MEDRATLPHRAVLELEYLEGKTLAEWMAAQRADPPPAPDARLGEMVRLGLELCDALYQLQGAGDGIVHRDLKPDNLMVTNRGLRVFDLNVSGSLDSSRYTRVGTPRYMAPEVEAGHLHDHRADHYSVGVILFEVLTRRAFDVVTDCDGDAGDRQLVWPPSGLDGWSAGTVDRLGDLLCSLVCPPHVRIGNVAHLRAQLEALRPSAAGRTCAEVLASVDMIGLLSELRPSGLVSVVADVRQRPHAQSLQDLLRARMQVDDALEPWLVERMEELLTDPTDDRAALVLLAGNAGDGKSHLIDRLLCSYLDHQPDLKERVVYIADATHAHSPDQDQRERLRDFFSAFRPDQEWDGRVRLIAMNTGMVINFFEAEDHLDSLYQEIQTQLGLRSPAGDDEPLPFRVEAVNLDLRNLVDPCGGQASFLERMIHRLRVDQEGTIPADHWPTCQECSAFHLCPVAFNLRTLALDGPRRALMGIIRRASLDAEVHLSPRNLWAFLYRVITGGKERYAEHRQAKEEPCDVVRRKAQESDGSWLLAGQFSQALFGQAGAGRLWDALIRHDPAFSSAPHIDELHTLLSIRSELDSDPDYVERVLGGEGQELAGLSLGTLAGMLIPERDVRRDAAVRRQFFFHEPTFNTWQQSEGSDTFVKLLEAYAHFSRDRTQIEPQHQDALSALNARVQRVFQHGHGRRVGARTFLQVSQPNVRSKSELLVEASDVGLRQLFAVSEILATDPHVRAHKGRMEVLDRLGYRPVTVQLRIAGVRLVVDLDLYDFLCRVEEGQKPSQRDLAQFQALVFVGERIGNQVAEAMTGHSETLFVYDGETSDLYELRANEWGSIGMNRVAGGET